MRSGFFSKEAGSAALAAVGALLLGCGSGTPQRESRLEEGQTLSVRSAAGLATGTVEAEGGHFGQGPNAFLIRFDSAEATLVSAAAFMPVHGHDAPSATIARNAAGYRVSDLIFSMPGLWDVTFGIAVGKSADTVEFSVDVP